MHDARIRQLNERPLGDGSYVLYWMQASQRAEFNPALEYAIRRADEINLGLVGRVRPDDRLPGCQRAALRVHAGRVSRGQAPPRRAGYQVRHARRTSRRSRWPSASPATAPWWCAIAAIRAISGNGARTLPTKHGAAGPGRGRCRRARRDGFEQGRVRRTHATDQDPSVLVGFPARDRSGRPGEVDAPPCLSRRARPERSGGGAEEAGTSTGMSRRSPCFSGGGTYEARRRLEHFLRYKLEGYDGDRSEPARSAGLGAQPYLDFGEISPCRGCAEGQGREVHRRNRPGELPRGADRAARACLQLRAVHRQLRRLCLPARVGA